MTGLFLVILGVLIAGSSIHHARNVDHSIGPSSEELSANVEHRQACPLPRGTPIQRILLPVDETVHSRKS